MRPSGILAVRFQRNLFFFFLGMTKDLTNACHFLLVAAKSFSSIISSVVSSWKNYPSKASVCSWEVEWGILVCFLNRLGHPLVLQIEIGSLWGTKWLQTNWASSTLQICSIVSRAGDVFSPVSLSSKWSPVFVLWINISTSSEQHGHLCPLKTRVCK